MSCYALHYNVTIPLTNLFVSDPWNIFGKITRKSDMNGHNHLHVLVFYYFQSFYSSIAKLTVPVAYDNPTLLNFLVAFYAYFCDIFCMFAFLI